MRKDKKIFIKSNECIKCKMCVNVCPAKIFIEINNDVEVDKDNFQYCIDCGDCLSVCTRDAVVNSGINTSKNVYKSCRLEPNQLMNFLSNRRTVRSYKAEPLTDEETKYLEKIASLSPRGGHTKGIRNTGIIIVRNSEVISEIINYSYGYMESLKNKLSSVWLSISKALNPSLKENIDSTIGRIEYILKAKKDNINMLTYDAPNLIILHSEKNSPISSENLTILEYQTMLGAETLDLGTCFLGWISFAMQSFRVKKTNELNNILKVLGVPNNRQVLSVFAIGKKKVIYKNIKDRSVNEVSII